MSDTRSFNRRQWERNRKRPNFKKQTKYVESDSIDYKKRLLEWKPTHSNDVPSLDLLVDANTVINQSTAVDLDEAREDHLNSINLRESNLHLNYCDNNEDDSEETFAKKEDDEEYDATYVPESLFSDEKNLPNECALVDFLNLEKTHQDVTYVDLQKMESESSIYKFEDEEEHDKEIQSNDIDIIPSLICALKEQQSPSIVSMANKTVNGRIYDCSHACIYCLKQFKKLRDHMFSKHSLEKEVIEALKFKSAGDLANYNRTMIKLSNHGDFKHNVEVWSKGLKTEKKLIVARRPVRNTFATEYLPCVHCLTAIRRLELWRHVRSCQFNVEQILKSKEERKDDHDQEIERKKIIAQSKLMLEGYKSSTYVSQNFRIKVLANMNHDKVAECSQSDILILKYGENLFNRLGNSYATHVSTKMRELGRILLSARQEGDMNWTLTDLLEPRKFDILVSAVHKECGFKMATHEFERNSFKVPSLALKAGFSLKECCSILHGIALRDGNDVLLKRATGFNSLYSMEWKTRITSAALQTLKDKRSSKPQLLPTIEDLKIVRDQLVQLCAKSRANLIESPCETTRKVHAEHCSTRLMLFNKRRSKEVFLMTRDGFQNRQLSKQNIGVFVHALSSFEKKLVEKLDVVLVRGKCARPVAVILTEEMVNDIQLLEENDEKRAINNPYVFFADTRTGHLKPYETTQMVFGKIRNIKSPHLLLSTNLRKLTATVSQVMDLGENDVEIIARHLGHNLAVHQNYYKLPDSILELAKVSKLLLALDHGQIESLKGKSLDQLSLDEIPDMYLYEDAVETDEVCSITDDVEIDEIDPINITNEIPAECVSPVKKGAVQQHRSWTSIQTKLLLTAFKNSLKIGKPPGKSAILKFKEENRETFSERSWVNIKTKIYNEIKKQRRSP